MLYRAAIALTAACAVAAGGALLLWLLRTDTGRPLVPGPPEEEPLRGGAAPARAAPPPAPEAPEETAAAPRGTPGSSLDLPDGSRTLSLGGIAYLESLARPLVSASIRVTWRREGRTEARLLTTGPDGAFRAGGLAPGRYAVTFEHGAARLSFDEFLLDEPVTDLRVVFAEGLRVWGQVRDREGRPAASVVVEWSRSQHWLEPAAATTDAAGRYELAGLEAGHYLVRVVPRLLRGLWDEVPARQFALRRGASNRCDLRADLGRRVTVRVAGRDGRPRGGVQVAFRVESPRRGVAGFLDPTGADGRALLDGLPPAGRLFLEAGPGPPGRWEQDLAADLPGEVELVVEWRRSGSSALSPRRRARRAGRPDGSGSPAPGRRSGRAAGARDRLRGVKVCGAGAAACASARGDPFAGSARPVS